MAVLAYDDVMLREPRLLVPGIVPNVRCTAQGLEVFLKCAPRRIYDDIRGGSGAALSDAVFTSTIYGLKAHATSVGDYVANNIPVKAQNISLIVLHATVANYAVSSSVGIATIPWVGFGDAALLTGPITAYATDESVMLRQDKGGGNYAHRYIKDTVPTGDHVIVVGLIGNSWQFFMDGNALTTYDSTSGYTASVCNGTTIAFGACQYSSSPALGGYSVQLYAGIPVTDSLCVSLSRDPYQLVTPA